MDNDSPSTSLHFKKGDIVEGPFWNEPVRIVDVQSSGAYIDVFAVGERTGKSYSWVSYTPDQISEFKVRSKLPTFDEEPWRVFLALETLRYRHASSYDPLLALNISRVDPLPHQIEAVYGYILKLPKIRFLIADDPGAGKTIMAGLVLSELKLRGVVTRTLIVAPGHLKYQWQREMLEKFNERFQIIDRATFRNSYGIDIWEQSDQAIVSMDFAKQDDILETLKSTEFNLIIVDEAHKMSASSYGPKINKTARYTLGEVLSEICEHLLFLTATPHKGDQESFRLFLDLLQPGFFANRELIAESIKAGDNPLFIRRLKEDLKDFDGKPLFLPRHVKTVSFSISKNSPEEVELYNKLSQYVEGNYRMLSGDTLKVRNVKFALSILQRRFSSSVYAVARSLERRKEKLETILKELETKRKRRFLSDEESPGEIDFEELDEMDEGERWKLEERLESLTASVTPEELRAEIMALDELIRMARRLLDGERELKLRELKKTLRELSETFSDPSEIKIVIFTESKDTLDYLTRKVREFGYSVVNIHGGMSLEDRIKAEQTFRNEAQVLIATEAAGEGINLQFCNLMINYDIPWNPNRLEQRMGRIHRYGQTREVTAFNFVSTDTREGTVLSRLLMKLDEIRKALGSDKVFDVVGEIIDAKWFMQLLIDAAVNARSVDEILAELESNLRVDREYLERIREQLGESLATKLIDYSKIRQMQERARENRLVPEYVESFFLRAFERLGGKVVKRADGSFSVLSVPYELRRVAENQEFKRRFGELQRSYQQITFDKELARRNSRVEFVSFGHPLLEVVFRWVEENLSQALVKGSVFYDPENRLNGYILFFEGGVNDFRGVIGAKLFSVYVSADGKEVRSIPPSIIWDLQDKASESNADDVHPKALDDEEELERLSQLARQRVMEELEKYKSELSRERQRQAEIKRKYGLESLNVILSELDDKILEFEARLAKGENVKLTLDNLYRRRDEYWKRRESLKKEIEREQNLSLVKPEMKAVIVVRPAKPSGVMSPDARVEEIGMTLAMEFERKAGRTPEDVSRENLGYDIRSVGPDGEVRYIEVKARADRGDVVLTQNEWLNARKFGKDYYLYVVFNAAGSPELRIIQDPASQLRPKEALQVVYHVKEGDILYVSEGAVKFGEQ